MYPFEYHLPLSQSAALAACQGDSRYLAGGQSLVQAMKLRMSASERLVDLRAVPGLDTIACDHDGLTIAAMVRHSQVAHSPLVQQHLPALAELAAGIGDPMVRSMGTLGGALANADPAACYPAAVLGLGATVHTSSRSIAGDAFFTGLYGTALERGELITAVTFPLPLRAAYVKFKQPASRFALVGVFVAQGADGVRVAVTGAKDCVFRVAEIEAALGRQFAAGAAKSCAVSAQGLLSDLHASAAYRAAMIPVLTARAVSAACAR
jgi:carbon-monoxide dehydrogenase medium subunit